MGKPTHFSLFTGGVAGFDIAAELAGFTTIGQVEIDDYNAALLEEKHWPDVPKWRDIREVTAVDVRRITEVRQLDLITGGPPCQPVSVAGKRRGAADDRWLWPETLALVESLQPRWCCFENPFGFIGMGLDDTILHLESIGYEVGAVVLPASAVGAPHKRDRLFIVAHASSERRQQEPRGAHGNEAADEGRPAEHDYESAGDGEGDGEADVADAGGFGSQRAGTPEPQSEERQAALISGRRSANQGSPSGNVAHTDCQRRWREPGVTGGHNPGSWHQPARGSCGADVADTGSAGRQEQHTAAESAGPGYGAGSDDTRGAVGTVKPGLGGMFDGVAAWLDRPWPAFQGEDQQAWEPPRTVKRASNRRQRIAACGNAVVWKQVYPILAAIMAQMKAEG